MSFDPQLRAPVFGIDPTKLEPAVRAPHPTDYAALAKQRRPHGCVILGFYGSLMATFVLASEASAGAWIAGFIVLTILMWLIARQVWPTPPHAQRVVTPWGTRTVSRFCYRGVERVWVAETKRWRRPRQVALRVGRRGVPLQGSRASARVSPHPAMMRRLRQLAPRALEALCGYDDFEVDIVITDGTGLTNALDLVVWGLALTEALDRLELDDEGADLDREATKSEEVTSDRLSEQVREAWSTIPALRAPALGSK